MATVTGAQAIPDALRAAGLDAGRLAGSLRLVHTSDLHLMAARSAEEDLAMVRSVAATVRALEADVLAIAGDLFDHNRAAAGSAADLMEALAEPGIPLVILPGNHDPLVPESIYRRIDRPSNVFVLGLDGPELVLPGGWSIVGRPHLDYGDFTPLDLAGGSGDSHSTGCVDALSTRVVLAHGHYDLAGEATARHRPGWLITPDHLDRLTARYVGLGHWDRPYEVRPAGPPTYYCGSPWLARSVNVVDLAPDGRTVVARAALDGPVRAL